MEKFSKYVWDWCYFKISHMYILMQINIYSLKGGKSQHFPCTRGSGYTSSSLELQLLHPSFCIQDASASRWCFWMSSLSCFRFKDRSLLNLMQSTVSAYSCFSSVLANSAGAISPNSFCTWKNSYSVSTNLLGNKPIFCFLCLMFLPSHQQVWLGTTYLTPGAFSQHV